ncbi:hypothetical protein EAF00_008319 [Botryotinia globosa]|nr:hypothetical protein EAF00_008319 [Botryotinia globosa]
MLNSSPPCLTTPPRETAPEKPNSQDISISSEIVRAQDVTRHPRYREEHVHVVLIKFSVARYFAYSLAEGNTWVLTFLRGRRRSIK